MDYQVYAIKYATRTAKKKEYYYGSYDDIHEDESLSMDYFVWLIKSEDNCILVDTGFTKEVAIQRKREFIRDPIETLADLNIKPTDINYVIITHMHYDHIGNLKNYPNAKFIIQEKEMAFWTGRYASKPLFKKHIEEEDVIHLVEENFKERVIFVDNNEEIFPGINIWYTGGHSAGLQIVTVETSKGRVVLASDALHFYENLHKERPFSTIHNLEDMYKSFDIVNKVTVDPNLVVAGHDPKVLEKFTKYNDELEGLVVKIV